MNERENKKNGRKTNISIVDSLWNKHVLCGICKQKTNKKQNHFSTESIFGNSFSVLFDILSLETLFVFEIHTINC